MKVKELIKQLEQIDGEVEILLSSDPEGNTKYELTEDSLSEDCIYENNDGEISVYSLDWSAEDADMEEDDWEEAKKELTKCVILYP